MRNVVRAGTVQDDMGKHRWFVLVAALVLISPTVVACATPTGTPIGDSTNDPAASATTTASPDTGGTQSPREEDPGKVLDPPMPGTPKTLRGTPFEGVEAGCVLLRADDGRDYLLLGGDRALIMSGARIEVEAMIQPDLMTTCQQGIPAVVKTVRKI
jgi:hypothetical protein